MALSQRRERLVRRLHQRKTRVREGLVLVEGIRAVHEALDSGANAVFALHAPELERSTEGTELLARLADVERVAVTSAEVRAVSATERPQGVLLVCEEPRFDADACTRGDVLVLDAVQDPGNVGTLIRSAAAFGFGGVLCLDGTTDPWGAKAIRSSAGTVFRIPVSGCELSEAVRVIGEARLRSVVGAADGRPLGDFVDYVRGGDTEQGMAVIVGNEGAGVRPELRSAGAEVVAIEMTGGVESLNAGIAGSILMYRISEARR